MEMRIELLASMYRMKLKTTTAVPPSRIVGGRFIRDDSGYSNPEYAVLFAVVAIAGFLTVWILRVQMDETLAHVVR